ncbi:Acetyl-CoA acetyltransferase [Arthrobacter sp. cf158]|uniref:thiolase family protein n=1 Tax=Arthrobacter sp. cf158 TaxID=1761744 RepID=UPI000894E63E|nr:thiolase family protein [Arthrobacter sp. cf158]SDX50371.1 Acetyl-CoA acetyltransferase [Arthrobacter sp. cf158]
MASSSVISGVGDSTYQLKSGRTVISHMGEAVARALQDAQLAHKEIDGLIVSGGLDYDLVATNLGLETRTTFQTWNHGRFTGPVLQMADAAVRTGQASNILCLHGRSGTRAFGGPAERETLREGGGPHGEVSHYGLTAPGSGAAMAWRRYTELYDADPDSLAAVAVSQRANAQRNPNAVLRDVPLDEATYIASPWIIEPLRRPDFALPNDGAVAVIVSRDSGQGVRLVETQGMRAGRSEVPFGYPGLGIGYQDSDAVRESSQPVYQKTGLSPQSIDVVSIYDSFAPQVVFDLERFGFCDPGMGWKWIADGRTRFDGPNPVNTSGGHIAESGQGGWNHVVELSRQLRGQCGARQVAGARLGQYIGPMGSSIILEATS